MVDTCHYADREQHRQHTSSSFSLLVMPSTDCLREREGPSAFACRRCGRTGRHWGRQISITVVTPVNCLRAGGPEESDSEHLSVVFPPSGAATTTTVTREAQTVSGEVGMAVAAGGRERNEGSYDWGGSALKQEGSLCKASCGRFYAKTMSKSIFLFFVL
jgi:hypothetical protein